MAKPRCVVCNSRWVSQPGEVCPSCQRAARVLGQQPAVQPQQPQQAAGGPPVVVYNVIPPQQPVAVPVQAPAPAQQAATPVQATPQTQTQPLRAQTQGGTSKTRKTLKVALLVLGAVLTCAAIFTLLPVFARYCGLGVVPFVAEIPTSAVEEAVASLPEPTPTPIPVVGPGSGQAIPDSVVPGGIQTAEAAVGVFNGIPGSGLDACGSACVREARRYMEGFFGTSLPVWVEIVPEGGGYRLRSAHGEEGFLQRGITNLSSQIACRCTGGNASLYINNKGVANESVWVFSWGDGSTAIFRVACGNFSLRKGELPPPPPPPPPTIPPPPGETPTPPGPTPTPECTPPRTPVPTPTPYVGPTPTPVFPTRTPEPVCPDCEPPRTPVPTPTPYPPGVPTPTPVF